jgi:SAM-dependent methyltransferase
MANRGDLPTPGASELLERFLAGRPPRTGRAYRADLDDFARFAGRSRAEAVAELLAGGPERARLLLSSYAAHLRRLSRAQATVDRRLRTLRSLARLARESGLVDWTLPGDGHGVEGQGAEGLEEDGEGVAYVLPRHPSEIDRLDLQHFALAQALGGHYLAPVRQPARVLDVGAGTGQWGYDVSAMHPDALVVALDLKAPKPDPPPRCVAVIGNLLQGLPFAGDSFDLVHQRLLFSGIPVQDWPVTVRELVRTCRPGGWIELLEGATRFEPAGPATRRLTELLLRLNRTTGLDSTSTVFDSLDGYLAAAGAREVVRRTVAMPLGDWAGVTGSLMASDIRALFTRVSAVFTARFRVPARECVELVRAAQLEWEEHHTTYDLALAWGQKPAR